MKSAISTLLSLCLFLAAAPGAWAQANKWEFQYQHYWISGSRSGQPSNLGSFVLEETKENEFRGRFIGALKRTCGSGYKKTQIQGVFKGYLVIFVDEGIMGCSRRFLIDRAGEVTYTQELEAKGWVDEKFDRKFQPKDMKSFVQLYEKYDKPIALEGEPPEKLKTSLALSDINVLKEREAKLKAELELERLKSQIQSVKQGKDAPRLNDDNLQIAPGSSKPLENSSNSPSNRKLALVIGNDSYKNVPKLENAVGDSKAISTLLARLGYEVLSFNNLNEKEFKRSLRQFKQRLKGGEEVVFFFAGHGVQIGSANFLLPTDVGSDSEDQIQDEGIPLQRVLDDFSESKVKFSLAMVDACRDNPFKTTGRSIGGRGLASTSAATGQMVIFSAGVGQQALDRLGASDKSKNGVFTRVLIEKVEKSKEPIHILMRDVREEVAKLAQSIGHEQVPAIYDQVIGNFYFSTNDRR